MTRSKPVVRALGVLGMAWTVVVIFGLLFLGPELPAGGCWRLAGPPPECLDQLAAANEEIWRTQTLPKLAGAIAGYVILIVLTAAAVARTRTGDRTSG